MNLEGYSEFVRTDGEAALTKRKAVIIHCLGALCRPLHFTLGDIAGDIACQGFSVFVSTSTCSLYSGM